jgi:ubiquinol-cytochrome c reductase cytochrome b subunit
VLMGAAMFVLFLLPWLDRSPVRSIRYKGPLFKVALTVFTISFVMLGWLGLQPATGVYTMLARVFTVLYFAFFLLMPIYSKIDKTKTPPDRITYHG